MRITIFSAGSLGDIQPCLLLGKALQHAGYAVSLTAPLNFAALIGENGLGFHPLHADVQQIMAGDTGREFMEKGGSNPLRAIRAMRTMLRPVALRMAEDALEAGKQADALLALGVFAPIGATVARLCQIPLMTLEPTPLLPTAAFPAPGWPLQRNLGGALNHFSGRAMLWVIWQWYGPFVNEFRRQHGLPPLSGADFPSILASTPLLAAYSPQIIPQPADWPAHAHITGYWFPPPQTDWQPPADLLAFLERGDPPVYIGFGSMTGKQPERFARLVLAALQESGRRGLLLTGWGGLSVRDVPNNVHVLSAAPHTWLFPRMAAVIHHGGAGTTAEGLRNGKPTGIVPFIVDQPFWGRRVQALGVGPAPITAKEITVGKLAQMIANLSTDAGLAQRAGALGAAIRAEDGLDNAVELVRRYLGG